MGGIGSGIYNGLCELLLQRASREVTGRRWDPNDKRHGGPKAFCQ